MRAFRQGYALQRAEAVVQSAVEGREVGPLEVDWLLCGLLAYLRGEAPLEHALGLVGTGRESPRVVTLRAMRDWHLCQAVRALEAAAGWDQWESCRELAKQARTFASAVWPREQRRASPPDDWPPHKRALFAAMRTGQPLPKSARQLHRIVTRGARFSCHEPPLTVLGRFI